jgi:hypothetical protein
MAIHADRENFLPVRKKDLIDFLCRDKSLVTGDLLSADDQQRFRRFCEILSALYHHEFHARFETLKDAYAPFDPDADTRTLFELTDQQRHSRLESFFGDVNSLLERANYTHLTREQIQRATEAVSNWGLNMDVDFDAFERLEVYIRGDSIGKRTLRRFWNLYRREELNVPVYKRLVLILKQRPHRRLGRDADTKSVFLKIFKDIPKVDIEMLLPGGRTKMPKFERGKLGVSLASTVGFVGWKLAGDLAGITQSFLERNPLSLYGPLSVVLGYGYKQYYGYQQTKQNYAHLLTQSLYYQNLDSNAGVLFRLLDEAEEQDAREAILAYFFLWRYAGTEGWTAQQLDDYIELDFERRAGIKFDFEIDDALTKLERAKIAVKSGDRYRVVPIDEAMTTIDAIWDNIFVYYQAVKPN